MRLATQYGILNEQISSLEGFRLQYIPQYMVQQDNWHRPLAKPAYTAENEQQSHKRQIANLDNVDQAMKNYLSTKNAIPGSLVGFPESSDDQGAQVSEAIEAMMQTAGSAEEMELKKRDGPSENAGHELPTPGKAQEKKSRVTAYDRVKDHHWSHFEVELMAWKLLVSDDTHTGFTNMVADSRYCRVPVRQPRWATTRYRPGS